MSQTLPRTHCTLIPDDWKITQEIAPCCAVHDDKYVAQTEAKTLVDLQFAQCVYNQTHSPIATFILMVGVMIGGCWMWYRRILKRRLNGAQS